MKTDVESAAPNRLFLKDYQPPTFEIVQLHLHFNLHETKTLVTARMQMRRLLPGDLVLNGVQLKLISVKLNEQTLTTSDYVVTDTTLTLPHVDREFTLETVVEINPDANKSGQGLYISDGILTTQCEAEGFRHITYFLDRPDVMAAYTVTIEADQKKYPQLLSNGDCIQQKTLLNGRLEATWKDPFKKPCYLFALVAGDLGVIEDSFITQSGKKVLLQIFAPHGKQNRCHHAMESLKKSMKWDEQRFGLEYDLNQFMIVSIDNFNSGAMENKGLNIFNSRLVLADPQSATDLDYHHIESVVAHEYFHNWTGNRVTCRNWFELSLKEGLTVFRDQEFSSDLNSRAVERIRCVDRLRGSQFAEDSGPNAHPVRPDSCLAVDNFYTPTIYEKGAEIIRMMQTIVGVKGFRRGMDEYFKRHDGQAVTILDFAAAIADSNEADFEQLKLWYGQSGTPTVNVTENYDAIKKEYRLTLKQFCAPTEKQPVKKPFHIPLLIGLLDSRGQNITLQGTDFTTNSDGQEMIHLKAAEQTFVFANVNKKPVLSLNREFSAPIKLYWEAPDEDLFHLIKFDSDSFNRREASYKMMLQEIRRLVGAARRGEPLTIRDIVLDSLKPILTDEKMDSQFRELMLQLPDHEVLAQEEDILDAVAFEKAYDQLNMAITKKYGSELLAIYKRHADGPTAGDRALKNRILSILVKGGSTEAQKLATLQFETSSNMTDKMAALMALCQTDAPEKNIALNSFYNEWKDDAVVFNKWVQVQAGAVRGDTFAHAKEIPLIAPFSFETPNNVYSLLTVLGNNFLAMTEKNGEAYAWMCDQILKVDAMNPQVAARVCGVFNFVKKLPPGLKEKAQTEIRRVLDSKTLSRNSRELLEGSVN